MMKNEFHMSIMGELIFFLGIQVKQIKKDTFVHQAKYTNDLMKKSNMAELKPMSTPMSTTTVLNPDENGEVVDQREYMSMIGSLLYVTMTQPDIQFVICLCARLQASPHTSHRQAV
jgi:isopentenyldiphosphate isomerase